MKLVYSQKARDRIRALPPEIKLGIRAELETLKSNPYRGKPLELDLAGLWSLPFKRYRILYEISADLKSIRILTVEHRTLVYQEPVRD